MPAFYQAGISFEPMGPNPLASLAAVLIALVTVSSQAVRGALLNPSKSLKTE